MVKLLRSVAKNYDWGTVDAMSTLMGAPPTGQPEAELWFGSHPRSDCTVVLGEDEVSFESWLSASGRSVPFLVKFLAAEKPLSIQVHPTHGLAREGCRREDNDGVPFDSPLRVFPDPYAKPELLIALSDSFDALWGFLPQDQLLARADRWTRSGMDGAVLEQLGVLFAMSPTEALSSVFQASVDVDFLAAGIGQWSHRDTPEISDSDELERDIFRRVSSHFPGDPGIVVASLMHAVRLKRGEGLYVLPGDVHAYVRGFGLEVMTPSDNVIRGGLTIKRRDASLFMSVARCESSASAPLVFPRQAGGRKVYSVEALPFRVSHITQSAPDTLSHDVMLVAETGGFSIRSATDELRPEPGTGVFVASPATFSITGQGSLWGVDAQVYEA